MQTLSTSNFNIKSTYLGRLDFAHAFQTQEELREQVRKTGIHQIIGLEHPAVITLGYRAVAAHEVLASNRLPVKSVSRGGFATLHSEGQLVIYPVLDIRALGIGVRDYICLLLATTKDVFEHFGVGSFVSNEAPGLYTERGKIAFCGIHVSHGITQHGISINLNNDLSLFQNIRSCGVEGAKFDRLADHAGIQDLSVFYSEWVQRFIRNIEARS